MEIFIKLLILVKMKMYFQRIILIKQSYSKKDNILKWILAIFKILISKNDNN